MNAELEKLDENIYEKPSEDAGPPKRYYFENLKISIPQVKLSVFTSPKLPPDLKVTRPFLLLHHFTLMQSKSSTSPPKVDHRNSFRGVLISKKWFRLSSFFGSQMSRWTSASCLCVQYSLA